MYKVYGALRTRAFRVLWALEELGQPYELVQAGPHSPEVKAVYPAGKIPVLEVDGAIISDSTAIMTFLADRHGALTHPAGSVERGQQDAMTNRLLDEIDSALWVSNRHMAMLPEERRAPDVVEACKWEFANSLARLEADFTGPFLTGDQMTVADIIAVHCFGWARSIGFPDLPEGLRSYAREMRARPAFQATMQIGS